MGKLQKRWTGYEKSLGRDNICWWEKAMPHRQPLGGLAQRVRKLAIQFKEKLANLIKGLLSAKIIQPWTSPWASPIVISVKKNGVDIRLCTNYRLVNDLTQLMV